MDFFLPGDVPWVDVLPGLLVKRDGLFGRIWEEVEAILSEEMEVGRPFLAVPSPGESDITIVSSMKDSSK